MSETLLRIQTLAASGEIKISAHGYDELAEDGLFVRDLVEGLKQAVLVTAYRPDPDRWSEDFLRRKR
jgi:hypothetical protein